MSGSADIVLLICADAALTKRYVAGLSAAREYVQVPLATSLSQARHMLNRFSPDVILLDESAFDPHCSDVYGDNFSLLAAHAPVILVAATLGQNSFTPPAETRTSEIVDRSGNFIPIVLELVESRLRVAAQSEQHAGPFPYGEDFGELLRHEMNNPLTGILGNAQLLLEKRERLPEKVVTQIEIIAKLALRLRKTIQRLSETWESTRDHEHTI
jgi:signal transduction histidine kinase